MKLIFRFNKISHSIEKKTILLFIILISVSEILPAQSMENTGTIYAGFSFGINNPYGLAGLKSMIRLDKQFSAVFGAGLGFWGAKGLVAASFHYPDYNGWSICAGYSLSSGIASHKALFEIINKEGKTEKKEIIIDYEPAGTINLTAMRNKVRKNGDIVSVEMGYAFPLRSKAYKISGNENLSKKGKDDLKLLQPGGLILSFSYCFAIN